MEFHSSLICSQKGIFWLNLDSDVHISIVHNFKLPVTWDEKMVLDELHH